jgi:hypothetical protein
MKIGNKNSALWLIPLKLAVFISLFTASVFMIGCSDSTSPQSGEGQLLITMVDSPAGYDQVNIVVTRVDIHKSGSDSTSDWYTLNNIPATYDLMILRNGASVVLGNNSLNAGHYSQIRLIIGTGSNINVSGTVFPLDVSSGSQTGIKLNRAFDIQDGRVYELLLDFDAERSIVLTGNGQYKLKPVIRVVPTIISGTISGNINPVSPGTSVFIVSGTDTVSTVPETNTGAFKLMAILQGTYNVNVISANAAINDTTIVNVIVAAKQNTDLGTINLSTK